MFLIILSLSWISVNIVLLNQNLLLQISLYILILEVAVFWDVAQCNLLDIILFFFTPLVCSQLQVDALYIDLNSAFDLIPHALLLHKLIDYGLSVGYVKWFHSYPSNRTSHPTGLPILLPSKLLHTTIIHSGVDIFINFLIAH
jgi:hypothetical protein